MNRTHVAAIGAFVAAGWWSLASPQAHAAPQQQLAIKSARHDACSATLRIEVANVGVLAPTVLLGAYTTPLSLVSSSASHVEVSVPASVPAGSYRLTVLVGNSPHEYDEAWVVLGGACNR